MKWIGLTLLVALSLGGYYFGRNYLQIERKNSFNTSIPQTIHTNENVIIQIIPTETLAPLPTISIPVYMSPTIIPKNIEMTYCNLDADCISIRAGPCGCGGGGADTAINGKYAQEWNKQFREDIMCPTYVSNHESCRSIPRCIDNNCQLVKN